jgi:glutathione S-transferase
MSITLYAAPMSSATPVAHALLELEVPHEQVTLDLAAGDQKKPEFLALNPNGKVPTLVVDGTPMFEALAIMQWLGDRFGVERGLWPAADAPERLEALSWTTWSYVTYGTQLTRLTYAQSENSPAELHHRPQAEHALKELQDLLGILEARLENRPYLLGESFTLADHIVASVVTYSTYCGVPVDDHPHVADWLARFRARPSFAKIWGQPGG